MPAGLGTNPLTPLPPVAVGLILLAEGYASLAAEILALRRMVPWAGSAVSVTAVLLAVYLAALAGGYRRGGRLARCADPRPGLAIRLAAAAAWAAFWLSGRGHAAGLRPASPRDGAGRDLLRARHRPDRVAARRVRALRAGLLGAGATRPVRLAASSRCPPFGNVGGALLTTFVLLRFLGTAAATIALVAALCLAALAAHRRSFPALALLVAALFPALDLWIEATEYVERNAYADYRIVELDGGGRMLDVSGQAASRHDAGGRGWAYAERVEKTSLRGRRDARARPRCGGNDPGPGRSLRPGCRVRGHRPGPGADRRDLPAGAAVNFRHVLRGRRARLPPGRPRRLAGDRPSTRTPIREPCPSTCSPSSSTGWRARGSPTAGRCT